MLNKYNFYRKPLHRGFVSRNHRVTNPWECLRGRLLHGCPLFETFSNRSFRPGPFCPNLKMTEGASDDGRSAGASESGNGGSGRSHEWSPRDTRSPRDWGGETRVGTGVTGGLGKQAGTKLNSYSWTCKLSSDADRSKTGAVRFCSHFF